MVREASLLKDTWMRPSVYAVSSTYTSLTSSFIKGNDESPGQRGIRGRHVTTAAAAAAAVAGFCCHATRLSDTSNCLSRRKLLWKFVPPWSTKEVPAFGRNYSLTNTRHHSMMAPSKMNRNNQSNRLFVPERRKHSFTVCPENMRSLQFFGNNMREPASI